MPGLIRRVQGGLFPDVAMRQAFAAAEAGKLQDVFPVLAKAAQKGQARAQYWVGKAYLEGRGVPRSRASATQWLTRAGEAGDKDAQAVLAALYLTGASKASGATAQQGVASVFADDGATEPDFERALHWAKPAADAGSADAQALLGYLLTSGPAPMQDHAAALEWYRKSAAAGCGQGSLGLALALLRDAKDDTDRGIAAAEMAKAAEAGRAARHLRAGNDAGDGHRRRGGYAGRGPPI